MSFLDDMKGKVGGMIGSAVESALPQIIERAVPGGLQGLLNKLQQSGYGRQVESWLGREPNQPITAQDLEQALNNQQVRDVAAKLGIPVDQVLETLSKILPKVVDQHSPDGTLRSPPAS